MMQVHQMESPAPSQPPRISQMLPPPGSSPARELRARPSSGRSSPGSTIEMPAPLVEEMRRPPIPPKRLDREMAAINLVVLNLGPKLDARQAEFLDAAAEAARNVTEISPKTEFFARLGGGPDLFTLVLAEFGKIAP